MARKKEPEKAPNHERWLVSYGDFITLLFAVFVTLYAMSQVDKKKVEQVASSYRVAFGISVGVPPGKIDILQQEVMPTPSRSGEQAASSARKKDAKELAEQQKVAEQLAALQQHLTGQSIDLNSTDKGLVITLRDQFLFDSGSAEVKEQAYPLLSRIGDVLAPLQPRLSIEGHTDDRPVASTQFQSNWDLSAARALSVANFFMARNDFSPENFTISGFGQFQPVDTNETDSGRARNRRVDIVLPEFHTGRDTTRSPFASEP